MKKTYIIHIETEPLSLGALLAGAPEFKAAANLKDPVKIAEDIEKKKNKYIAEAQFNEAASTVCAVGLTELESGKQSVISLYGGDNHVHSEQELFSCLLDKLKCDDGLWADTISFRGEKHMYPFLARRGAIHSLPFFSVFYWTAMAGRLKEPMHFDMARVWACGSMSHPESLDELVSLLKVHYVSSTVPYYKLAKENPEEATAYLLNTLDTLEEIYGRVKSV